MGTHGEEGRGSVAFIKGTKYLKGGGKEGGQD